MRCPDFMDQETDHFTTAPTRPDQTRPVFDQTVQPAGQERLEAPHEHADTEQYITMVT